ncbi:MAG: NAD(P)-dependent oxidoreductase [Anaerolineae bacterium]|nr:NAD(P)-dependent oxidoreductase [Anaerolineae bacterium]
MKIFLAGATGAIGRLLVPLLFQAGHDVAGTTRSAAKCDQIVVAGARPVIMDAYDRDGVFAALHAERPDVVIHMLTDLNTRDFPGNSRLRIEGTRNLVDAARAVGVQRMIAESISWICAAGEGLSREDDPLDLDAPAPRGSTVAATKALEDAVAEIPKNIVLRYGILYGPGTWYSRDEWVSERMRKGEIEANDAVTSFIHVADAAQAARQALDWPAGIYNVVDDDPAAATAWVPLYARLIGAPPPPVRAGKQAWERGASNAKARGVGWRPQYPTWREGFTEVLA